MAPIPYRPDSKLAQVTCALPAGGAGEQAEGETGKNLYKGQSRNHLKSIE